MELEVQVTTYAASLNDIRAVRDAVFLQEQQISRDDEVDDRDEHCRHVVVYADREPIGTGRLDAEKDGKIGRVAVLASHRRQGVGRLVMQALEREAQALELPRIWFHAQHSAIPFYVAQNYETISDEFLEAGIVHVKMQKRFQD